jgi:hypothetical protein
VMKAGFDAVDKRRQVRGAACSDEGGLRRAGGQAA